MANGRDSDRPVAPHKNGKDQAQDREIRDLKEAVNEIDRLLDVKTDAFTKAITNLERSNDVTHGAIYGELKTGAAIAKILWGLAFLFLTSLGGLLGYGFGQIDQTRDEIRQIEVRLHDEIQRVDARTAADWAKGRKWGEALDKDVARLLNDIRVVRERIDRHHSVSSPSYRHHDFTKEEDLSSAKEEK